MSMYVSLQEFKSAPTGIDLSRLDQTNIGNQAAQDNALLNVLRSASGWVNRLVKMDTLEIKTNTETKEVYSTRDGRINIFVRNAPIISLSSAQYRFTPSGTFTDFSMTDIEVYKSWFTIYALTNNNSLTYFPYNYYTPFQYQRMSDRPISLKYTYISGYLNTILQSSAAANATTITVKSATGVNPNDTFTIYDADKSEDCTVQSVAGNVITLSSPLLFAHNANVAVSAIPSEIKEATILLAGYLIKDRGSLGITMSENVVQGTAMDYAKPSDIETAKDLLAPFVRPVIY